MAQFWLLEATDSLSHQSRRNPDGAGIGAFDAAGKPVLTKRPIAAWEDAQFAAEAMNPTGTTFLAHVWYATTGNSGIDELPPMGDGGGMTTMKQP
jgi:glutamine amidotransferase